MALSPHHPHEYSAEDEVIEILGGSTTPTDIHRTRTRWNIQAIVDECHQLTLDGSLIRAVDEYTKEHNHHGYH